MNIFKRVSVAIGAISLDVKKVYIQEVRFGVLTDGFEIYDEMYKYFIDYMCHEQPDFGILWSKAQEQNISIDKNPSVFILQITPEMKRKFSQEDIDQYIAHQMFEMADYHVEQSVHHPISKDKKRRFAGYLKNKLEKNGQEIMVGYLIYFDC